MEPWQLSIISKLNTIERKYQCRFGIISNLLPFDSFNLLLTAPLTLGLPLGHAIAREAIIHQSIILNQPLLTSSIQSFYFLVL